MTKRKPPIRHKVKSHTREGNPVREFERGKGARRRRRVAVKEKYPKKVAEHVYIYEMLDKDQKDRFNIWLRIRTLQDRWHKTHRINWKEADRVLEDANSYMAQKKWGLVGVRRREVYMNCLRAIGRQDDNAFVSYMDDYKWVLHNIPSKKQLWGESDRG